MNKIAFAAFAVLLLSATLVGAQNRKTLGETVDVATIEAQERQRILAELEEVHQLRERMLQEGESFNECVAEQACLHPAACILLPVPVITKLPTGLHTALCKIKHI